MESKDSFRKFASITKYIAAPFFVHAFEWEAKRKNLIFQLADLQILEEQYRDSLKKRNFETGKVTVYDMTPTVRLSNSIEAIANSLYSLCEIAALFANKASGKIPSKFNAIRKSIRAGKLDAETAAVLSDLQWYEKIREIRTEWTHFSSIFIGHDKEQSPSIVIRNYRHNVDKEHFKDRSFCSVIEFDQWVRNAILVTDKFAQFLLDKYLLSFFDRSKEFISPVYDSAGWPLFHPDGRMQVETMTVDKFLKQHGY